MEKLRSEQELRQLLLEELKKKPRLRRKALLEQCVAQLDFTQEELKDFSVGSPVVQLKSRMGALLTQMIHNGDIEESESGYLTVQRTPGAVLERDRAAEFILQLLQDGKQWPRHQIFNRADRVFQPADQDTEAQLHALLGQTIQTLEREKRILEGPNGYRLPVSQYPNTELGYWMQEAKNGANLCECFLNAVHTQGGEWLESYAVRLLSEYYRRNGKTVTSAYVTGGSNDGGLDGVIQTTDWMGFRESILLQMKNRYAVISPKDVREFYGAVCIAQGSRGIFVTISSFHNEAQKLLQQVDNLIGVDGRKLFEIAKRCGFGIKKQNGCVMLDEAVFLERGFEDNTDAQ